MDEHWLNQLDSNDAVLVPTRSLANALKEEVAQHNIAQGQTVWEAPNIMVWADYLDSLWQSNRELLSANFNANNVVSTQQSLLLWTQVIEASRREERELTLLNVQQTARAVQRSWRLMGDWQISPTQISEDHVADTAQFLAWIESYQIQLDKRALIDEVGLLAALVSSEQTRFPNAKVIWYAFDLITAAQRALDSSAIQAGVVVEHRNPQKEGTEVQFMAYPDARNELEQTFVHARQLLEADPAAKINIVVPDLQLRQSKVRELARQVFYPAVSPLQIQQNNTAYRFSLGQPLKEWAAVETALSLITLLKNRCTVSDLSFLLRNQFLRHNHRFKEPCRAFDHWLKGRRMRQLLFDNLPSLHRESLEEVGRRAQPPLSTSAQSVSDEFNNHLSQLVEQRQALQTQLQNAKQGGDSSQAAFAALSFAQWAEVFSEWLAAWGWQTTTIQSELNTVQHQLLQRWQSLLEEFSGLSAVQSRAGTKRAIDVLDQMARDAIFLPKAAASPIVISSVFEAIGRPVDMCFLTGMSQDYPAPPRPDAFVPKRLLAGSGHPDVTAEGSFQQARKVNQSLLAGAKKAFISYPQVNSQDIEIGQQPSTIYRGEEFASAESLPEPMAGAGLQGAIELEDYLDAQGPAWQDASLARGGSKIFENQSNCEFKAFVTHQLGFQSDDEAEFGLDGLDRGNVVHYLLDLVWGELQTQQSLLSKSETELNTLLSNLISDCVEGEGLGLTDDKRLLLRHEKPRLLALLKNWLAVEASRPEPFSVVEREEARLGEFAGIKFKFIVDRLDMTDDGRSFIIDYKTGTVNRNDWLGKRIKSPQMPLYAVALDAIKSKPVSGIAYAKVNQSKHEFVELSDAMVFKKGKGHETVWQSSRPEWEAIFEQLASDFLAGNARVNPIDQETCRFCELQSVCRVSQLRDQEYEVSHKHAQQNSEQSYLSKEQLDD